MEVNNKDFVLILFRENFIFYKFIIGKGLRVCFGVGEINNYIHALKPLRD